jgi:hypothetical protein
MTKPSLENAKRKDAQCKKEHALSASFGPWLILGNFLQQRLK